MVVRHRDIGIPAWIIQDGSYPDFEGGQTEEFAVEYSIPNSIAIPSPGREISVKALGDALYDTVGDVVVHNDRITVLEIGIRIYHENMAETSCVPRGASRIAAILRLAVDAFSCYETVDASGEVVPLVYSWRIHSILMQTAPFMNVGDVGMRDPQRLGYEEIAKTDAWKDDGGHASYILRCELLPVSYRS